MAGLEWNQLASGRGSEKGGAGEYNSTIVIVAIIGNCSVGIALPRRCVGVWNIYANDDGGSLFGDRNGEWFGSICGGFGNNLTWKYVDQKIKITFLAGQNTNFVAGVTWNFWGYGDFFVF